VSNGALFHHFRSKEAIAGAIYADAIRDFQSGHWRILTSPPETLRACADAIVGHHLQWVEANPDRARFLYESGRLDGDSDQMRELKAMNAELAKAYSTFYRPFVERGEARLVKPGLVVAIVSGPAHEVCRRWLNGDRSRPLTRYTAELAHAAWAALAGPAALASVASSVAVVPEPRPRPIRVRVELLGEGGESLGHTEADLPPSASA
jgi:AcrR family transcriptional regulator